MPTSTGTTRLSHAFSLVSSSDTLKSSLEAPGAAIVSSTLEVKKGQRGGRRRQRTRPTLEAESDHNEVGTQSGPFNLIAKTSQAFLQALGDYQQEDGTAHAPPEVPLDAPEVVTEEIIEDDEDTEEEDGGEEDGKEDDTDPKASPGECSPTLTALGARRAWRRLRLHIKETAMKKNNKESILGWRFLRLAVSSLSHLERTREELYERYIEKPESWTDALVNCPDHLRFRNFQAPCSISKVPRLSSGGCAIIGDGSSRRSPLSARNRVPYHVTGRSFADHVTKTGSVGCRPSSGVDTKTVDSRIGRDLPRTKSAFVRKPRIQSSTKRGESAKARVVL